MLFFFSPSSLRIFSPPESSWLIPTSLKHSSVCKCYTSEYFLPGTFCHLVPPCLRLSKCTINSLDLFLLTSPPHLTALTTGTAMRCVWMCVCVRVFVCVCPKDLWVSSCAGNLTLRPRPVAADGKNS